MSHIHYHCQATVIQESFYPPPLCSYRRKKKDDGIHLHIPTSLAGTLHSWQIGLVYAPTQQYYLRRQPLAVKGWGY